MNRLLIASAAALAVVAGPALATTTAKPATPPSKSQKAGAKVQKATLDPTKISGRCGRLKCCLRYEYDIYEDLQRELPGQILVEAVEMPDGAAFLCIARTLEGPQGAFAERPRRTALLLGCDISFRDEIVYGAALPTDGAAKPAMARATPVGPACRVCERVGCLARAEPPVTRPLGLDEMATGLSAFDFQ